MKTPANVRITENTCKSFFRCLGKFAVRNDSVTQNELDSVIETWKEWGVCRETSTILLRELIAGRDSKKTFEQLFNEFLRDLTPEDRCSCDIVHAFVNMAYARKKRLPLEVRERLISIGKALSQEEFLQNFMNIYDDLCEDDPEPVQESKEKIPQQICSKNTENKRLSSESQKLLLFTLLKFCILNKSSKTDEFITEFEFQHIYKLFDILRVGRDELECHKEEFIKKTDTVLEQNFKQLFCRFLDSLTFEDIKNYEQIIIGTFEAIAHSFNDDKLNTIIDLIRLAILDKKKIDLQTKMLEIREKMINNLQRKQSV